MPSTATAVTPRIEPLPLSVRAPLRLFNVNPPVNEFEAVKVKLPVFAASGPRQSEVCVRAQIGPLIVVKPVLLLVHVCEAPRATLALMFRAG